LVPKVEPIFSDVYEVYLSVVVSDIKFPQMKFSLPGWIWLTGGWCVSCNKNQQSLLNSNKY